MLLSAVVVVNFFFTLCMFLTPDPETTSSWLLLFTSNVTNTLIQGTGDNVGHLAQGNSEARRLGCNRVHPRLQAVCTPGCSRVHPRL